MDNTFAKGVVNSLTGPIERADINTISSHIEYLKENDIYIEKEVYLDISLLLIEIAKEKNPNRNYDNLSSKLKKEKGEN